jgi:hypothetical protein
VEILAAIHLFARKSFRLASLLICAIAFSPSAQSQSREYQLKAAFLFNFAQFTDWPDDAFPSTNSPFVIGILGQQNPFGSALTDVAKGETLHGRPIEIRLFQSIEEIHVCHILFVNPVSEERLPQILDSLRSRPILTVSDMGNFARRGGIIRFLTVQNKIRFRINLTAARNARLTLSSKLLRLSEVVPE